VSYLLFVDESGHDHRRTPYEVRCGVALHAADVWPFVQAMRALEEDAFGAPLHRFGSEIKGRKLLDRDRFRWDAQEAAMPDVARRRHASSFLRRTAAHEPPKREEFTAYGQASLYAARGVLSLLEKYRVRIFASAVPRGVPAATECEDLLRKDSVFLLERYFYFLEEKDALGLLVFDETDKALDRRYLAQVERYFTLTANGRLRTRRIVPAPLFVSSDLAYPVQSADVCAYCINWGFRQPERGMAEPVRQEIADLAAKALARLQWRGTGRRGEQKYASCGIVYVADPCSARRKQ
jgi:hypothetical protein